jgi:hypothetical protein
MSAVRWCPAGAGDAFSLQLPRLGQLSKACLWLEGPGSPWHLNLLVVTGPEGEEVAGTLPTCVCCSTSWTLQHLTDECVRCQPARINH